MERDLHPAFILSRRFSLQVAELQKASLIASNELESHDHRVRFPGAPKQGGESCFKKAY